MINLIYNKDIKAIENKTSLTYDESILLQLNKALETKIQQRCKNIVEALGFELERKFGKKVIEFVHIDNGGKMGIGQKMKKKAEGVKKGFPDAALFCGSPCGQYSKVILVEFKRMGITNEKCISDEQRYYHDWLNSIGFSSYITNNPIFFRDVIRKEVLDFYNNFSKE